MDPFAAPTHVGMNRITDKSTIYESAAAPTHVGMNRSARRT